jgi:hypothetical protein
MGAFNAKTNNWLFGTCSLFVLLGGWCSFLYLVFQDYLVGDSLGDLIFYSVQVGLFFFYVGSFIILVFAFIKQKRRLLQSLQVILAALVIGSLTFFIIYVIYPLYLTRLWYCAMITLLLGATLHGSTLYLQFPVFGVIYHGISYLYEVVPACVGPTLWMYFIGPVAFYPGKLSLAQKFKKYVIFYFLFHIINMLIIYVEIVLNITQNIPWAIVHTGLASTIYSSLVRGVLMAAILLKLFPEPRKVLVNSMRRVLKKNVVVNVSMPLSKPDKIE